MAFNERVRVPIEPPAKVHPMSGHPPWGLPVPWARPWFVRAVVGAAALPVLAILGYGWRPWMGALWGGYALPPLSARYGLHRVATRRGGTGC